MGQNLGPYENSPETLEILKACLRAVLSITAGNTSMRAYFKAEVGYSRVMALVVQCMGTALPPRELLDCCLSFVLEATYSRAAPTVPLVRLRALYACEVVVMVVVLVQLSLAVTNPFYTEPLDIPKDFTW